MIFLANELSAKDLNLKLTDDFVNQTDKSATLSNKLITEDSPLFSKNKLRQYLALGALIVATATIVAPKGDDDHENIGLIAVQKVVAGYTKVSPTLLAY